MNFLTPASSHRPQQRVVAHRDHKATRKACRRPSSQRDAQMMNEVIEARRPTCPLVRERLPRSAR